MRTIRPYTFCLMASTFRRYDGLILLAACSTKDLSNSGLTILSVYGSEDRVLNREKYEGSKKNLPAEIIEIITAGGRHAGFGVYDPQDNGGIPAITSEALTFTAAAALSPDPLTKKASAGLRMAAIRKLMTEGTAFGACEYSCGGVKDGKV